MCHSPRIKLVTVLAHGWKDYVFAVPPDHQHGASMTIEILNQVLLDLQKTAKEQKRPWPRHLWVQLDNTCKENKNKYLMQYGALIVNSGAFRSVGPFCKLLTVRNRNCCRFRLAFCLSATRMRTWTPSTPSTRWSSAVRRKIVSAIVVTALCLQCHSTGR